MAFTMVGTATDDADMAVILVVTEAKMEVFVTIRRPSMLSPIIMLLD